MSQKELMEILFQLLQFPQRKARKSINEKRDGAEVLQYKFEEKGKSMK